MAIDHPSSVPQTNFPEPRRPWNDEILEQLYAYRAEYAARFDYDLQRVFADLKAKEESNPLPRADLKPLDPEPETGDKP